MNWNQLEEQWIDFAGAARAHWIKLTEDDWQTIKTTTKKEHLIACIRERYGIANEEAEKQVNEWADAMYGIGRGEAWLDEYYQAPYRR